MTYRPISPELLSLTIESLIDAGASEYEIRSLIYIFTPADLVGEAAADETVGFLSVADIPASHRGEFLELVLELDPRRAPPSIQMMPLPERKSVIGKAAGMWQSARATVATAIKPSPRARSLPFKRGSAARMIPG